MSAEALRLLTPEAVRTAAKAMLAQAQAGQLQHLVLHQARLPEVADLVAAETRQNYPALDVPLHARWRHFVVGGADHRAAARGAHRIADAAAAARSAFDVAIVSVLLDAGAGMAWRYRTAGATVLARSEGLAIASLDMLAAGRFADDGRSLRADAAALRGLEASALAQGFQVGPKNPLVGLEGRAALLRRLGDTVAAAPAIFGQADTPRPGGLFDLLVARATGGTLPAREILVALLRHLGPIWPGRETLHGVNLGDCWRHAGIGDDGLVPFHKLSQWLAYSLVEPLQQAGITVTGIEALTGLPEYRNGGLFLDFGVLALRDPAAASVAHDVGSALVVEWRALTVALLDALLPLVRERLAVDAREFPLACMLQGGTWSAGRRLAAARRADGGPPLRIVSDGTVF